MKTTMITIGILVLVAFAGLAWARGNNARVYYNGEHPMWNDAEPTTLSGVIKEIATEDEDDCPGYGGVEVTLESGEEIHMGPAWYWDDKNLAMQPGEKVSFEAVASPHGDWLLATSYTCAGETHNLRDEDGYPVWSHHEEGRRGRARGYRGRGGGCRW